MRNTIDSARNVEKAVVVEGTAGLAGGDVHWARDWVEDNRRIARHQAEASAGNSARQAAGASRGFSSKHSRKAGQPAAGWGHGVAFLGGAAAAMVVAVLLAPGDIERSGSAKGSAQRSTSAIQLPSRSSDIAIASSLRAGADHADTPAQGRSTEQVPEIAKLPQPDAQQLWNAERV